MSTSKEKNGITERLVSVLAFHLALERFSNDCRKTIADVIILTNHKRDKQRGKPIRIISFSYLYLAQSAGKIVLTRCDWFWFWSWLSV